MHEHHIMAQLGSFSFFLAGLLGSLHCAGMCGPLSTLIHGKQQSIAKLAPYHLGRIFSYMMLGFLAASLGLAINPFIPQSVMIFLIVVPLMIYASGIHLPVPHFLLGLSRTLFRKTTSVKPQWRGLFMGLFTPLLPCGLLYATLAAAAIAPNPWIGALWMGLFASGTIPILIASHLGLGMVAKKMGPQHTARFLRGCALMGAIGSLFFYFHHSMM